MFVSPVSYRQLDTGSTAPGDGKKLWEPISPEPFEYIAMSMVLSVEAPEVGGWATEWVQCLRSDLLISGDMVSDHA